MAEPGIQTANQYLDSGIALLTSKIVQLEALRKAGPEVAETFVHVQQVWRGDRGWAWLLRYNAILEAAPIDALAEGRAAAVRELLGRIEHGIAV